MTYEELLREHVAQTGTMQLNLFGAGDVLWRGEWFAPGRFMGDREKVCEAVCEMLTAQSRAITGEIE